MDTNTHASSSSDATGKYTSQEVVPKHPSSKRNMALPKNNRIVHPQAAVCMVSVLVVIDT